MNVMPTTPSVSPAPPVAETNGRLAALRALQKAIEANQHLVEEQANVDEGKGQRLDLRC